MTEFLRMNGMYWGLTSMALTGQLDRMDRSEVISFVKSCQHECGGFSCSIGHDPHLLATLSAVQVGIVEEQCLCRDFCWHSEVKVFSVNTYEYNYNQIAIFYSMVFYF